MQLTHVLAAATLALVSVASNVPQGYVAPAPYNPTAPNGGAPTVAPAPVVPAATTAAAAKYVPAAAVATTPAAPAPVKPAATATATDDCEDEVEEDCEDVEEDCEEVEEDCEEEVVDDCEDDAPKASGAPPAPVAPVATKPAAVSASGAQNQYVPAYTANQIKAVGSDAAKTVASVMIASAIAFLAL
ncbi:hypothetical protein HDU98_008678 [Podochytrium sp. JEL0797]|nr:hypothetical protein HDU98_008678 [Podochytrium sp. JEL0797]